MPVLDLSPHAIQPVTLRLEDGLGGAPPRALKAGCGARAEVIGGSGVIRDP